MGFWGVKILARTGQELGALTAIKDFAGEFEDEAALENGWRLATIHGGQASDSSLASIVAETGAAVLVAEVADSDFAAVTFAGPGRSTCRFVLHPRSAKAYGFAVDQAEQAAAPAALIDWAGGSVDEAEVRKAVGGHMVFAEDSFVRLAGALGAFPIAELEDYIFGPMPADEEID